MTNTELTQIAVIVAFSALGLCLTAAVAIFLAAMVKSYATANTNFDPSQTPKVRGSDDPAWPNYLLAAVHFRDLARLREREKHINGLFTKTRRRAKIPFFLTWPLELVTWVFLEVLNAILALVTVVVALLGRLLFAVLRTAMSVTENVMARIRGADASCPNCFAVMDRPAYECPKCDALHRDIRAGSRGAIYRVCACGHRLPTGTRRASVQLRAVCQECGGGVHRGASVLQDVRVPVFGEPHAGKTRLIFAGIHDLLDRARREGADVRFADDDSKKRAEFGLDLIRRSERTLKTGEGIEPSLTCEIRSAKRGALLHTFDAAGEHFRGGENHDELRYLDGGHTLVFVVDPFAMPGVNAQLASLPRTSLLDEHLTPGTRNPEESYGEVVTRLRSAGADTDKQRLAIVVTKADLLAQLGVHAPTSSDHVKEWLYDSGMHNLVLAAEREFKEVRYFTVASIATHDTKGQSAAEPFIWALTTRKAGVLTEQPQVGVPT